MSSMSDSQVSIMVNAGLLCIAMKHPVAQGHKLLVRLVSLLREQR